MKDFDSEMYLKSSTLALLDYLNKRQKRADKILKADSCEEFESATQSDLIGIKSGGELVRKSLRGICGKG